MGLLIVAGTTVQIWAGGCKIFFCPYFSLICADFFADFRRLLNHL